MNRALEYNELAEALLGLVEAGATDQSDEPFYIPAKNYTDPVRWSHEIEHIFKRLPLMLGFSIELPNPGDFKTIKVVGLPVLITRDRDGTARAFLNVCTHRGAPVTEAESGNAGRFTCRYHGWTFANDGRLIGVSDKAKFGNFDTSCRNLTALPCEERAGMIFVILTPGLAIDVASFLGGMLDELAHYKFETWHYHGKREIYGANWKIAYDGYLENYHFAALHATTIAPRSIVSTMQFKGYGPHMRIAFPSPPIKELYYVSKDDWWTKELSHFRAVRTLFPNIAISLAHGMGQVSQLIPGATVGENRTILNYISPHPPENEEESASFEASKKFLGDVTNDEDYVMGLAVQEGLRSGAIETVIFGRNERGNQHFHRYIDFYLSGDDHSHPPIL